MGTHLSLRGSAKQYLALRRAMGYTLARHDHLLGAFLDHLEERQAHTITVADALGWACSPTGVDPRWHAVRLAVVRGFAAHVHAGCPQAAELIPAGLVPSRVDRPVPYLYTDEQITALITEAHTLRPVVRGLTLAAVIAVMAATGMRIGEALALDASSLDTAGPTLRVRGKYAKVRLLPIHRSTAVALTGYLRISRSSLPKSPQGPSMFLTCRGTRPRENNVQQAFRAVTRACQPRNAKDDRGGRDEPRLHDLRHSFAVNTLIDAHHAGVDVDARIAALATYLGHVSPESTYWYLSASPELLDLVNDRIQATRQGQLR